MEEDDEERRDGALNSKESVESGNIGEEKDVEREKEKREGVGEMDAAAEVAVAVV